jgi:hypothetical protein
MVSESARVTTAAEARFRIDATNSAPRVVKVIALDAASEDIVKRLAERAWKHTDFLIASAFASSLEPAQSLSMPGWLGDLAGRASRLVDEIEAADLVILVATPGGNAPSSQVIAEACRLKGVMTTALIVGHAAASAESLSATLAQLRPYAPMLVLASNEDYVVDMLTALRG